MSHVRHVACHGRELVGELQTRWGVWAEADVTRAAIEGAERCAGCADSSRHGPSARASRARDEAHSRLARALRRARRLGNGSATDPSRGRAHCRYGAGAATARASSASLRASRAESALAIGHLHVSLTQARAALPDWFHGRPFAFSRVARAGASPTVGARHGGIATRNCRLRST